MSARRGVAWLCAALLGALSVPGSDLDSAREEVEAVRVAPCGQEVSPRSVASFRTALAEGEVVTGVIPCAAVIHERLPEGVARRIAEALPVAVEHVRDNPACQELFERLGADALTIFARSIYYPMPAEHEREYCRLGRIYAVTTVGGDIVLPCRSFARLSAREAAIILIHEALHHAGQTEYPSDPDAPDSEELTRVVMRSCRLY